MRSYDAMWESVTVRGKAVRVTLGEICEFYNLPYYEYDFIDNTDLNYFKEIVMDNIVKYLIEGRDE